MSLYSEVRPRHLAKAIQSIGAQTFRDFRFMIAIDGPIGSELENVLNQAAEADKRIAFVRNKRRVGLSESMNRIIRASDSAYVARMDADDWGSNPHRGVLIFLYILNNTSRRY